MKKLLFALLLGILLMAAIAMKAVADNGPHGGAAFANGSTDACAGCHRLHSSKDTTGYLLTSTSIYGLCTSCHDGTGAYTDVVDGYYTQGSWSAVDHGVNPYGTLAGTGATGKYGAEGLGLFGGGFVNTRTVHTWNAKNGYTIATTAGYPTNAATTDAHEVGEGLFTALGTMWGSGDLNSTPNGAVITTSLQCTDCHDPHGNAGRTGGVSTGTPLPSYRLLRFNPTGSNGFDITSGPSVGYFTGAGFVQTGATGGVYLADVATKWYTPNTDNTNDTSVMGYTNRWDGAKYTAWTAILSQPGDAMGRYYMYRSPAIPATGYVTFNTAGTLVSSMATCKNAGGNLPPLPATQFTSGTPPVSGTDYYPCDATSLNGGAYAGPAFDNTAPRKNLGMWCSLCHDRYLSNGGRTAASGDANFMYRHTTTGTSATSIVCTDCHESHGTSSLSNGLAAVATFNVAHPSDLLKWDNRSLCMRCHGASVNFTYTP